jgi:DNA-binding transcriptional MerR regulator
MTSDTPETIWTLDEIAAEAGLPPRTIRYYQARGALMRPELRGRVAYYGPRHLERLRLIAQLQDRGLRIEAIRDLVGRIDRGELDLGEWLGVEQQVQTPWAASDQAQTLDEAGLYSVAGTKRAGLIAELVRARLVQRRGEVYLVPSPSMLQIALRFEAVGIPLAIGAKLGKVAFKHLDKAVDELVATFVKSVRDGAVALSDPDTLFSTLRPLGTDAVALIFARRMERALHALVASDGLGRLATLPKRSGRRPT